MKLMFMVVATLLSLVMATTGAAQVTPIGQAADIAKATRTVTVDMSDFMMFNPSEITAKKGEIVHFVIQNKGEMAHEFVFGTPGDLYAHAQMMKKYPNMVHEDPGHYTVQPGKTVEFAWQFTDAGVVNFACLVPGHYDAGMRGTVTVK